MSTFPSLRPTDRTWTDGSLPTEGFIAMAGTETRFVTGSRLIGQQLVLTFAHLSEADALLITQHYQSRRGSYLSFNLPAAVFAGWSYSTVSAPNTNTWRYSNPPKTDFIAPGIMSVTVNLVAVAD